MYDHYGPEPPLRCPRCGALLQGFQGKDGPCKSVVWKQGEAAPVDQRVDDDWRLPADQLRAFRLPPSFEIYGLCPVCPNGVDVTGLCEDSVWQRCVFGRHANATAIPARSVLPRWRQCSRCAEAWQEDDSVTLAGCPGCGALTELEPRACR